jgi:hypothetical protein
MIYFPNAFVLLALFLCHTPLSFQDDSLAIPPLVEGPPYAAWYDAKNSTQAVLQAGIPGRSLLNSWLHPRQLQCTEAGYSLCPSILPLHSQSIIR